MNRTARAAGVESSPRGRPTTGSSCRGRSGQPLSLTLDDLRAAPQRTATLPIACVEGWSTSQPWTGVPVRDLLARAGAPPGARVQSCRSSVTAATGRSDLDADQAHDPDTLLALRVDGEALAIDHGYPVRLIGPNRPGVMQTKWVTELVVR